MKSKTKSKKAKALALAVVLNDDPSGRYYGANATKNKVKAIKAIKNLVAILNSSGVESAHLWALMSAMRGPDNDGGNSGLKWRTTARIRGAVGLDMINSAGGFVVNGTSLSPQDLAERDKMLALASADRNAVVGAGAHFGEHYRRAVDAIRFFFGYDLDAERPCECKTDAAGPYLDIWI